MPMLPELGETEIVVRCAGSGPDSSELHAPTSNAQRPAPSVDLTLIGARIIDPVRKVAATLHRGTRLAWADQCSIMCRSIGAQAGQVTEGFARMVMQARGWEADG